MADIYYFLQAMGLRQSPLKKKHWNLWDNLDKKDNIFQGQ